MQHQKQPHRVLYRDDVARGCEIVAIPAHIPKELEESVKLKVLHNERSTRNTNDSDDGSLTLDDALARLKFEYCRESVFSNSLRTELLATVGADLQTIELPAELCFEGCDGEGNACDCCAHETEGHRKEECCCLERMKYNVPYDAEGRLKCLLNASSKAITLPVVYECHEACGCYQNSSCRNSVVHQGIRLPLEIYFDRLKGWCVNCSVCIKAGQFICEYSGKVLSSQKTQSMFGSSTNSSTDVRVNYTMVLREHFSESKSRDSECKKRKTDNVVVTAIDASKRGNVGRFINHSCSPNAIVVPVRGEFLVPRAAIFALEDIEPYQEITISYTTTASDTVETNVTTTGNSTTTTSAMSKSRTITQRECRCGASNCQQYLPFDEVF
eukprot:TRINITY_DN3109_c0_g1_i3.p1 TRINITY_DN3109_c0_g1~~TRINITY_DN3109_c0_g1_i3.p1  ORF type:complete len:384 (-),score=48.63 TRINITY_DN3109_c0_g1_i3:181-1332(-)